MQLPCTFSKKHYWDLSVKYKWQLSVHIWVTFFLSENKRGCSSAVSLRTFYKPVNVAGYTRFKNKLKYVFGKHQCIDLKDHVLVSREQGFLSILDQLDGLTFVSAVTSRLSGKKINQGPA